MRTATWPAPPPSSDKGPRLRAPLRGYRRGDALLILTAVEQVCLNYGKPDEERLSRITVADCERYIEQKHYRAPAPCCPKIQAAMRFASSKPGRRAIITSLDKAVDALAGKAGTVIVQ